MNNIEHLGDSFRYMEIMQDQSVDAILTDPDFGIGRISKKWSKGFDVNMMFNQFNRIIKPNGIIIIFSFGVFTADLIQANRKNYRYSLVWEKDRTTGFLNAKRQPLRSHEDILIFYKKQPTYNPIKVKGLKPHTVGKAKGIVSKDNMYGSHIRMETETDMKYPRTVLKYQAVTSSKKLYATQKPVGLISYLINTYTNPGDVVLDPFCGSGTTAIACMQTNRKYVVIDRDERAINIARQRINIEPLLSPIF